MEQQLVAQVDQLTEEAKTLRDSNMERSIQLCEEAYTLAQTIPYPAGMAQSLVVKGGCCTVWGSTRPRCNVPNKQKPFVNPTPAN